MSKPFENEVINQDEEKVMLNQYRFEAFQKKKKNWMIVIISGMILLMMCLVVMFLVIGLSYKKTPIPEDLVEILFRDDQIDKPLIDEREIRIVKLNNGLIATLISDTKTIIQAAGLQVHVGYDQDGEIKGLAHFTEHMVFLGSKTYPETGALMSFVTKNGGSSNAKTDAADTVYFFNIRHSGYDKALDMFCRMFNETLLGEEYMENEINAINSEYLMYLNQDKMREQNIILNTFGGQFPIGNDETLREKGKTELLNQVKRLIKQYYVAENMKLVMIANETLDSLQKKAHEYFGYIPKSPSSIDKDNKASHLNRLNTFAFHSMGNIGWFQRLSKETSIDFVFSYPYIDFKKDPLEFILYLLLDHNEGSFIYEFKKKYYINSFEIVILRNTKDHVEFYLHYVLTKKGIENIEEFIKKLFSYINKLKDKPIDKIIFEEYKKIKKLNFRFSNPFDIIYVLPLRMHQRKEHLEYLLYEDPSFLVEFNETLIKESLDYLSVDNCIIIIGSNEDISKYPIGKFANDSKSFFDANIDYYFNTQFNIQKIGDDQLKLLMTIKEYDEFSIRSHNKFISLETNLVHCPHPAEICKQELDNVIPVSIITTENCHIYHQLDRSFKLPKVLAAYRIIYPNIRSTDSNKYTQTMLFISYLEIEIKNRLFDAKLGGNTIEMSNKENGIIILINAYSDLIESISSTIFEIISKPNMTLDMFNSLIEEVNTIKSSLEQSNPYMIAEKHFERILKINNKFPFGVISDEYDVVKEMFSKFASHCVIEALFTGNILEENVIKLYQNSIKGVIDDSSKLIANQLGVFDTKQVINYINTHYFLEGSYVHRTKAKLETEENNAIANFYYIGDYGSSYDTVIKGKMLMQSWGFIFFERLRTEQQLGYIIKSEFLIRNNKYYYAIIIQGEEKDPKEMDKLIDEVIEEIRDNLKSYTEEFIESLRVSIKQEPTPTLMSKFDFMITNIINQETKLDRYDLSSITKAIDSEAMIKMFDDLFYNNPKKLSIQIFNKNIQKIPMDPEYYNLNCDIKSTVSEDFDLVKNNQS